MARSRKQRPDRPMSPNTGSESIPPGATRKAFERDRKKGGGGETQLGDRHAQGTPAGGTAFGGLGGTNVDEGSPNNADLEAAMGSGIEDGDNEETQPPYAGPSGGAVGGTPAEDRSTGGKIHRGLAPGASRRGDSTIGSDPGEPVE